MGSEAVRVLVVEDDPSLSEILCDELRARGHLPVAARSRAEGIQQLKEAEFDVALLDLMLPDGSGIDVLRRIVEAELPTEAIVLTGDGTVATALEATRLGAYDYLTKPEQMEKVELVVAKAAEKARLRRENGRLRARLERLEPSDGIVSIDPAMREALATLERVAASELPVLIEGESGTEKELVARAVHRRSPRAALPFGALNCAALPDGLIENELFGHERGAVNGAEARKPGLFELSHGGVVFLDGIGEISQEAQAKLVRALESKQFFPLGATRPVRSDVRLVAGTHKNLRLEMQERRFREDLYYRLDGVTLRLPPLRERLGDIPVLARHFLERLACGKSFAPGALEALQAYAWPGNVGELLMVVQRAGALARGEIVEREDLCLDFRPPNKRPAFPRAGLTLAQVEQHYIQAVLEQHDGHRGRTAKALGIDPKTLYNKLGPERPRKRNGSRL